MLADDLWTLLLGLRDGDVAGETEGAGWVVDGDEALPLLDGEGNGGIDAQAHRLALGVEGVEVDVGDDPERTGGRRVGEGGEVLVGEAGFAAGAVGGRCGRGGEEVGGGGHGVVGGRAASRSIISS